MAKSPLRRDTTPHIQNCISTCSTETSSYNTRIFKDIKVYTYMHTHIYIQRQIHPSMQTCKKYKFEYIHTCIHTYIQTYIQYITLHYIALHCVIFHYITLHYTTLHYTTLHYTTLHYTTLHTYIHPYNIHKGRQTGRHTDIQTYIHPSGHPYIHTIHTDRQTYIHVKYYHPRGAGICSN